MSRPSTQSRVVSQSPSNDDARGFMRSHALQEVKTLKGGAPRGRTHMPLRGSRFKVAVRGRDHRRKAV